jgi:cyclic 2,3-diphosphoglycerate synthetase
VTTVLALIDGEHYPDVTRWALERAHAEGYDVLAALLLGGIEKLPADGDVDLGRVPVLRSGGDARERLADAIDTVRPAAVLDLSDEPVLGYRERMDLIAVALAKGCPYLGPDFRFEPPVTEARVTAPTVAVFGSGKRVAKTAVAARAAALAKAAGLTPVIVAMGRGGPREPEVCRPGEVTVDSLLARADRGEHAASDFLEDALVAGVATVGTRRAGGGLAGRPFASNVAEGARVALELGADPLVLEGSGAALPPVPWDAGVLVIPASLPPEYLGGYLGPLRVLLSDLVITIIGESPDAGLQNLSALESHVRRLRADIAVAHAELHPIPLADVRGKDVFFATTSPGPLAERVANRLEKSASCRVVATSSSLSDRRTLERDLRSAPPFDTLLTELKGAAIDVGARLARERGAGVVFVENRPVAAGGDGDVDDLLVRLVERARERGSVRA